MYEVIHFFTDLQDNKHPYNPGDAFPREGMEVSEKRLAELSGSNNKQRKPLIKKIETEEDGQYEPMPFPEDAPKHTKSEINRMSTAELQNLAASIGVDGAFDMTGSDLKKRLISELNL